MPVTQRKRSFQLFRKLKFCSGADDDETSIDIDKMMMHTLDCLGALQCLMGRYDPARAKVFWAAVVTTAEIGLDSLAGHMDRRHPGATHLIRAFPNDAKATDGRGWLPLHWAAVSEIIEYDDVKAIAKSDPLATVKGFNQPISANPGHLIAAVRHPDMRIVKCLYDFYPRMANTKDNYGDLPLHYAARYSQNIEMVQYLLQANAGATKVHGEGDLVPLQCAIYNQFDSSRYEIVDLLLKADINAAKIINSDGDTALHLAVDNECDENLLLLLMSAYPEAVKIPNDVGLLPLHTACYSKRPNCEKAVEVLLRSYEGAATVKDANGMLPAHIASEYSTVAVLQVVLSAYPEALTTISDNCGTPLQQAVVGNNEATVRYLCEHYPESCRYPNSSGLLPLHLATAGDNLNIIKLLYETYPEAISTKSGNGDLPLHTFLEHQDTFTEKDKEADCLRFLIKCYPEAVRVANSKGEVPIDLCNTELQFARRMLLRVEPSTRMEELIDLNYQPRRMAMFLAFAAINANGEPTILCRLREANIELLQHTLSFL